MRIPNRLFVLATMTLALAATAGRARAQSKMPAPPPPGEGDVMFFANPAIEPMSPPEAIEFIEVEGPAGGKIVAGAPFTASFSNHSVQTLSDGNRIERNTTGTLARDAEGRTRRDMSMPAFGAWSASGTPKQFSMISDPVSGKLYILEPDKKIARLMHSGKSNGENHKHGSPGAVGLRKGASDSNATSASLGTQTISGVSAEGTRTTRTIPAGAIGNQLPIVITMERWYSADLQTVVMTKRSDPRMGETVMQLTTVTRQAPDASLFTVPADYTITRGRPKGTFHKQVPPPDAPASPQQ
jgi:hypothetical protein